MLLGPVADADTDDWRQMIAVNLLGLLYCTHAALPLIDQRRGRGRRERVVGGRPARRRRAPPSTT